MPWIPAFLAAIIVPAALIGFGHYFRWDQLPWRHGELSRLEAYCYGTASISGTIIVIFLASDVTGYQPRPAIWAAVTACAVASAALATFGSYILDSYIDAMHRPKQLRQSDVTLNRMD